MKKYITMSRLPVTEGLGSQMSNFAALYAIARMTGHRILFVQDLNMGKGLLLTAPFDDLPIDVVPRERLTEEERIAYSFDLDTYFVVDSRVFELDSDINHDIGGARGGLVMSYRTWYPAREEIFRLFRFKKEIAEQAAALVGGVKEDGREIVSLHVRRKDYLSSVYHANWSLDYYMNARSRFKGDKYKFLVFSDDIDWCRQAFSRNRDFFYSDQNSPNVDLCAMSLCDHNIVANSCFSMWGALLNKNKTKTVICPGKYFKEDSIVSYMNYAWFPDDWICLGDLLV
jgi:hypothetical protein